MIQLNLFPPDYSMLVYYPEPMNHKQRLLNLQYNYLVKGDRKAYERLWIECLTLAGKIIHKEQKKKGFIVDDYEDKKLDAVVYVLRRYVTTYGYYINNFVAAIYDGVRHALYFRNNAEIVMQDALKLMNSEKKIDFDTALLVAKKEFEKKVYKKKQQKKEEIKSVQLEFNFSEGESNGQV